MAWNAGVLVEEVTTLGPGLASVVCPEALSLMPLPGLFTALSFLMLLTLDIASAFSLVEPAIATILDRKLGAKRTRVAAWVCLAAFALGLLYTTRAGLYFWTTH
ncbi:hypothetical protein C7293_22970 [filamentous cyanobacterium CCT1]|nr:hypothetical protein C7293_22970 [filamentous cyanobacterium CCT1]PSN78165.1 hypothetical protein C8B47_18335 [filamentous cyanobacterium CCP4]